MYNCKFHRIENNELFNIIGNLKSGDIIYIDTKNYKFLMFGMVFGFFTKENYILSEEIQVFERLIIRFMKKKQRIFLICLL